LAPFFINFFFSLERRISGSDSGFTGSSQSNRKKGVVAVVVVVAVESSITDERDG
jgi:hypothetical protein